MKAQDFLEKDIPTETTFYFLGIGGIGMSSLAGILHNKGYHVAGSDKNENQDSIRILKRKGIEVHSEQNSSKYIQKYKPNICIYNNYIKKCHSGMKQAQKLKIPCILRSQLLGFLLRKYTTSIGVTGSHGKTTTSSIISHIFLENNLNPTCIVGGIMQKIHSNFHIGASEIAICEIDDAYKSLLDAYIDMPIVTSLSKEHLDEYSDLCDIKNTFLQYLDQSSHKYKPIINCDSENLKNLIKKYKKPCITYGLKDGNYQIKNIITTSSKTCFTIRKPCLSQTRQITINYLGTHFIQNMTAAYIAAYEYGISEENILKAIESFQGTKRRFELCGTYQSARVYDDYAHHPYEIDHAIAGYRHMCKGRLIIFFQPHKYSRTAQLKNEFCHAFSSKSIDHLIITDPFSAGEKPADGMCSQELVAYVNKSQNEKAFYIPFDSTFKAFLQHISKLPKISPDDIIICMGAGKLDLFAQHLVKKYI